MDDLPRNTIAYGPRGPISEYMRRTLIDDPRNAPLNRKFISVKEGVVANKPFGILKFTYEDERGLFNGIFLYLQPTDELFACGMLASFGWSRLHSAVNRKLGKIACPNYNNEPNG